MGTSIIQKKGKKKNCAAWGSDLKLLVLVKLFLISVHYKAWFKSFLLQWHFRYTYETFAGIDLNVLRITAMAVISFIFRTLLCFNIISTDFELFNKTHMVVSSLSELFSIRSESVIEINTMQFMIRYTSIAFFPWKWTKVRMEFDYHRISPMRTLCDCCSSAVAQCVWQNVWKIPSSC